MARDVHLSYERAMGEGWTGTKPDVTAASASETRCGKPELVKYATLVCSARHELTREPSSLFD